MDLKRAVLKLISTIGGEKYCSDLGLSVCRTVI